MELINQHTKKIMEECKVRAREAGLNFEDESLEYIVTNRDMLELSPKGMIPTMYDYWLNDVELHKKKGVYKLYPSNPYETVINSRPAISFYNDNNPDWLNVMIFYHVLAHIDFFQNNILFQHTWNDDFVGQALADKRLIDSLRSEHGRWTDYVIEFSRSIDNMTRYFDHLMKYNVIDDMQTSNKVNYYFEIFLQENLEVPEHVVFTEIEKYNKYIEENELVGETLFFAEVRKKYPEFQAMFEKYTTKDKEKTDLLEFIQEHSPFLRKEENQWMKSVMSVVRNTALYFSPQIRTKTINEGWASYWHDKLFCEDPRIKGHEVAYARINSGVTSVSRVGLNPYAIGLRLIQYIEQQANKGKLNYNFQKIANAQDREKFDRNTGSGKEFIFKLRKYFSDFTLFNTFIDQDFVDQYNLFVVGKHYDASRQVYQYYVKSRKAEDYKEMLIDSLYHPPSIEIDRELTNDENLYLKHTFENKQLYKDFVPETLIGLEYLWGGQVQLQTTEILKKQDKNGKVIFENIPVLYTVKNKKVTKKNL